jgi:hypothetical protein
MIAMREQQTPMTLGNMRANGVPKRQEHAGTGLF